MWKIIPSKFKHFNFVCNASKWAIYVRKCSLFIMDIFFPKKWAKNVQINHIVNTANFLECQLLLTKLQIVGYFYFKLFVLYCAAVFRTHFFEKRALNVPKNHSVCKSGFNHFWKIQVTFLKNFFMFIRS